MCIPFKVWLECWFGTLSIFDLSDKNVVRYHEIANSNLFSRITPALQLWCSNFEAPNHLCQTLWKTRPGSPLIWIWPKSVHLWVQAEGCAKKYPQATAEISCLWEQTDRWKHNASGWGCRWRGDIAEMLIQLLSCLISQLEKTKLRTSLNKIL